MEILLIIVFAVFGAAVGSFLNVCIDRLPAKRSLLRPPSHCDICQCRLSFKDLIPVASYLRLRGRCRHCRAPIPQRVFWVELGSGLLFAFIYWHYGLSTELAITALYSCVFIAIMVIDLEHKLILNKVTYPSAIVALIILAIDFFLPEPGLFSNLISIIEPSILSGIVGAAIGSVFFLIVFLINPRGMGIGDIKLAGLIGLLTGFPLVFVALFTGIILGGLVAIILILLKIKGRKDTVPYGVFLALGTITTLLWGTDILSWYIGLL